MEMTCFNVMERKRKRVVLTITQKLEIIDKLERGVSKSLLKKEYNVGSSTIYDIKMQKQNLLKFAAASHSKEILDKRRTLRKPTLERLDNILYEWFRENMAEGIQISGPMLIEKARELYNQMDMTESCSFSDGWLQRFKLRHGIKTFTAYNNSHKQSQQELPLCEYCSEETSNQTSDLEQLKRTVCEWRRKLCSEGTDVEDSMIIDKAKQLYEHQLEIKDPCTFSDEWLQSFKGCHVIKKPEAISMQNTSAVKTYSKRDNHKRIKSEASSNDGSSDLFWHYLPYSSSPGLCEISSNGSYDTEPQNSNKEISVTGQNSEKLSKSDAVYTHNDSSNLLPQYLPNSLPPGACENISNDCDSYFSDYPYSDQNAENFSYTNGDVNLEPQVLISENSSHFQDQGTGNIKWCEASKAWDILLNFAKQHPSFTTREIELYQIMRNHFRNKREMLKQTDIRTFFRLKE